jgi:Na+/H+ antiporter NhaD/arsenite permease-like protein
MTVPPSTLPHLASTLTIVLTYVFVALGRVKGLNMSRATIVVVSAAILLLLRTITQQQAFEAVDLGTLTLLFAMMVINNNLRLSGFFGVAGQKILGIATSPRMLLALVIVASGVLSAIFLNDPVCLLFTPLVIDVVERAGRNPIPYLMGLATAANIGSTATITGNPQNLVIGQASGIPYLTFLIHLAPIALVGLAISWIMIVLIYRDEFGTQIKLVTLPVDTVRTYPPLLNRTLLVVGGLLIAFLVGAPIATSALIAAAFLLITRIRPSKLIGVDGELLVFFSGLFIVTRAIETSGLSGALFAAAAPLLHNGVAPLTLITAVLSNIVSNVPAVLLFRPEIPNLANPQQAWLTLAMASTLAGNLTLLGSVANLIVAEVAAKRGIKLSFGEYLRAGIPITLFTLGFGVLWLSLTS